MCLKPECSGYIQNVTILSLHTTIFPFSLALSSSVTTALAATSYWWGKSITILSLDFFQWVLSAVKSKGLKQDIISRILINYTHNSLQGVIVKDPQSIKGSSLDTELQNKQKLIVEAIVSLLPTQSRKSSVPIAFLSSLLKTAIMRSTSTACRADLERRIGLQLDQAILEDIHIPANSHGNNYHPLYDINRSDSKSYRLCKTIDCQKLSQEAYSHATQNERLPQIRLRNAMNGGHNHFFFGSVNDQFPNTQANRELRLGVPRMRMRLTDLERDHVSMKQNLALIP
uniref:NPH3 domain-containing protein n=1 Tax=Nelumbo nucifera TaxID=4432 RepID=A0A822YBE0_NELNU|nr:TPA_asm: hypothetical protein HUJ06_031358 [Nelumbo nucifera]